MADTSVAAATEQERLGGGADVGGEGFQESYDDDDDDYDDKNFGGGGGVARAKRRPRAPPGHTSPLPQTTSELNGIIVPAGVRSTA